MTKMKDSGVKWIGQIPEDWTLPKVKNLFNIGRGRVIAQTELDDDGKYPVYSSQTQNDGCLGYINSYDFDVDQLTWTTDGANAGTVFLRTGKHNCTNVCGTLQQKNNDNSLKYLKYALEFIAIYHKRADTNGFKIMNNEMAEIIIPVPPLNIQKRIADFLDKKCGEIDELIAIQEKEIEKLKEYKTSVITKAVTKGLDDSVPMKDSGIDWIGEIPEHWKICKIKNIVKICNGREAESSEGDIPVYGSGGAFGFTNKHLYDKESVLLGRKGTIDKPIYIPDGDKIWCVDTMFYTIDKGIMNMKLFYYIMSVFDYKRYIYGTALPSMSQGILNEIYIPLPEYKEQLHLLHIIEAECDKMELLINKKQQKIEKLQEYKKSLIYEYVTGKKEV